MDDLIAGSLTLEAACRILADAARANPERTRFWPQRIEAAIADGRISAAAGRTLFDALEGFDPDKTVWIEPDSIAPKIGAVLSAPASARCEERSDPVADLEQLRAALFGPLDDARQEGRRVDAPQVGPQFEPLPAGAIIGGRYRLIERLGLGGVGHVYRAVDLEESREAPRAVTIKIPAVDLRRQPDAFEALQRAVVRSQALDHANIAALHDIGRDGDRVFIVMEPLEGRWLGHLIREVRGRGLAYELAWPIISGIALGLEHAHRRGVVHHDLSPHSVFLCTDGVPKIVGFGLLQAVPASNESLDVLDTQTLRAYSEAYTADPWAHQSPGHPADDLYPLGVMAYELLTGSHPFGRCSLLEARRKKLTYAPIPGLNRRARKLIDRCLSFERNARPEDASGFVREMRAGVLGRMLLKPV
jgi:hypothetical protein